MIAYIVSYLNVQIALYSRFVDDSSRHTLNLASVAWVLYSPTSDLVSLGIICLATTTNNLVEYHAVTALLTTTLPNDESMCGLFRLKTCSFSVKLHLHYLKSLTSSFASKGLVS